LITLWDRLLGKEDWDEIECPQCHRAKRVVVPGKYACSSCGTKFTMDRQRGLVEVVERDGTKTEKYHFNRFPTWQLVYHSLASLFLAIYGTMGLTHNDIYVPGKRSSGVHFHDVPAVLVYLAILAAILNLLSLVADHFDRRDNEVFYRRWARVTSAMGWTFFLIALFLPLVAP